MAKQKVKTTVKTRVKKSTGTKNLRICNVCHGTGVVRKK